MISIFKSESHQKEFDSRGFIKVPLLSEEEVKKLLSIYSNTLLDNKIEGGFFISLDNQDQELVENLSNQIEAEFNRSINLIFKNPKIFTASFVIKEPGLKNIVPPHQDWTFVEEPKFNSMTVWTPLIDVDENNGALCVIPGSHRLFNHPRSSPSPQSKSPLSDHVFTLFPYVDVIEMKAGEALIFDNRLIHASPPNLSEKPRIAVGVGITQKEAKLIHYYQNPGSGKLNCYEVNKSFFSYFNNIRLSKLYDSKKVPEGLNLLGEIDRNVPNLTKSEMEDLVASLDEVKYNKELMDKLARLFNYSTDERKEETGLIEGLHSDERTFFEKYTPANVLREIVWRAKGRPKTY